MKIVLYLLSFSVILSCGSNQGKQNPENNAAPKTSTEASTSNSEDMDTSKEKLAQGTTSAPLQEPSSVPVGEINTFDLKTAPHASWFNGGSETYEPVPEAMVLIDENLSGYTIKVFMGTWCPDSRREVPKFFKILELADYNLDNVTMYGVDRGKNTPENLQDTYNIIRVPTFIFFKNGKEINRFVEHSQESLEKDIAKIVSGQEYEHSYLN